MLALSADPHPTVRESASMVLLRMGINLSDRKGDSNGELAPCAEPKYYTDIDRHLVPKHLPAG